MCNNYVTENTYASGHYYGSAIVVCLASLFTIGIIACLLALVGSIGESQLRTWQGRPLTRWELLAAVPIGLLACVAVCVSLYVTFLAIGFSVMLCGNFAFDSVVGMLAIGLAACLMSLVGLVVYAFVRRRQGRSIVRSVRTATLLLSLVASIMLAVFLPLRAAEGRKQREIVAALEAMSHHVYYDYDIENDGHTVITKGRPESWVPDWLISLAGLDFFHRVVRVDLESTGLNVGEAVVHLRGLKRLEYVILSTEVPSGKIRQIEQALPSCEIKFIRRYEERPWSPPPSH